MRKGLFNHFITMSVLHGLLLLGSWQVVKNVSEDKVVIPKLGNGIMKLKVASGLFLKPSSPHVQRIQQEEKRVVEKPKPSPFAKPVSKPEPVAQLETPPQTADSSDNSGSVNGRADGTGGSPDGYAFGSGTGNGKFSALDLYKAELRATIDKNKYYPTMSRRLGQTGTVVIAFTLLEDGNIVNVRIDKPSQYERLNVSALDAVKKVERFKPIPKEVGDDKMDVKVPVKFVTI